LPHCILISNVQLYYVPKLFVLHLEVQKCNWSRYFWFWFKGTMFEYNCRQTTLFTKHIHSISFLSWSVSLTYTKCELVCLP
jgi:hypothetical protein